MNQEIKIESHVPVPSTRRRYHKSVFDEMKIGDSFLLECSEKDKPRYKLLIGVRLWNYKRAKKRPDLQFTAHAVMGGIRVWRINNMDTKYQIEKGVPFPEPVRLYPIAEMEIGDSFFVPITPEFSIEKIRRKVYGCIGYYKRNHPEKKLRFKFKSSILGVRIWRVK